jgi:hypothetical protein
VLPLGKKATPRQLCHCHTIKDSIIKFYALPVTISMFGFIFACVSFAAIYLQLFTLTSAPNECKKITLICLALNECKMDYNEGPHVKTD